MSTTSISGFWYIFERAYETPCTKIGYCMLMSSTSISGFWYIYERAYETPQYVRDSLD
jgi:hypothetical protein